MKYPEDFEFVFHINVIDLIMQDNFEQNFMEDKLNFMLQHNKIDKDARLESNEDIKKNNYFFALTTCNAT
jgi:hypothetical protein